MEMIGRQSGALHPGESVESVLGKKNKKATVGKICGRGRF